MNDLKDLGKIVDIITPVRLSAYGTNYADMLNGYIYNLKLSESFYPALSLLEITFRNKICLAIEKLICSDWLLKELYCRNILEENEYKKLLDSANNLKNLGKKITNDRLIAEMTFGFWVHLCKKSYRPKLWDKKGFFEIVFPNYKNTGELRRISPLQNSLLTILRLRNRIFHHEIIINNNKTPKECYQLIVDMLHLMSFDIENLLNDISNFKIIEKQKPR